MAGFSWLDDLARAVVEEERMRTFFTQMWAAHQRFEMVNRAPLRRAYHPEEEERPISQPPFDNLAIEEAWRLVDEAQGAAATDGMVEFEAENAPRLAETYPETFARDETVAMAHDEPGDDDEDDYEPSLVIGLNDDGEWTDIEDYETTSQVDEPRGVMFAPQTPPDEWAPLVDDDIIKSVHDQGYCYVISEYPLYQTNEQIAKAIAGVIITKTTSLAESADECFICAGESASPLITLPCDHSACHSCLVNIIITRYLTVYTLVPISCGREGLWVKTVDVLYERVVCPFCRQSMMRVREPTANICGSTNRLWVNGP